ncbi:MAG: CvpA family protein [Rickettsiales bacterium]|jgi:membrane protein required for colicin V production|nr:CvpA family protein [Rickettsiales bacterium]
MFALTIFDWIYIAMLLASTVWASVRGGVYETIATLSWVVAAVAARFISPALGDVFQSWFGLSEPTIGTLLASYFVVFFVILVAFGFINQRLRDKIQESMMRVTDHTLGILFGLVRGIVVMGLLYWGMLWYYSGSGLPEYVANARTRPIAQLTAKTLQNWFFPDESQILKRDLADEKPAQDVFEDLITPPVAAPEKPETESETGYDSSTRDGLDGLIMQTESSPAR